ncbi:MAG: glycosyltransferase family 39 protein [Anaerolineales bacterium]|nr:glycosyltransferase family 39 protein [Anaerolineales bacterium]
MWISGIGLKIFAAKNDLTSEQLLGFIPTQPGVLNDATTAGVIPLALVISICITLIVWLFSRLVGEKIAYIAGILLALDPFFITYGKVLHVDAILASFMLTSVLFFLNYLNQQERKKDLIFSGFFAGLSFLSKSPSLFLIPYMALSILVLKFLNPIIAKEKFWLEFKRSIGTMVAWLAVAFVTFVVLWPAMWVEPLDALRQIGERILFHVETAHYNPVFFNGQITFDDPGIGFYLATIAWKTTLITLPAVIFVIYRLISGFRKERHGFYASILIAFVFFFTIQMSISARKEEAYLLPVFPVLDLIAAFGLMWILEAFERFAWFKQRRWIQYCLGGLLLLIQAFVSLSHHPYYGTHHNLLLGGTRVAMKILPLQDQAEGLDLAAQYLNTLPGSQSARVAVHGRGATLFQQNFNGLRTEYDDPWTNYRVYFVNQLMRDLHRDEWSDIYEMDSKKEPIWTKEFDGVTYVWIYGDIPSSKSDTDFLSVNYQLGEHIKLEQIHIDSNTVLPGDVLKVDLRWNSDGQIDRDYTVFCHVLSKERELVAQQDGVPLYGIRSTLTWRDGELMEDSYEISIGEELPLGEYELSIGMYDSETLVRLQAFDASGERFVEDRIVLGTVFVKAQK